MQLLRLLRLLLLLRSRALHYPTPSFSSKRCALLGELAMCDHTSREFPPIAHCGHLVRVRGGARGGVRVGLWLG